MQLTPDHTQQPQTPAETGRELEERLEAQAGRAFPYATVGDYVLLRDDLHAKSKLVYWFLRAHVNRERGNDQVWPTLLTIADFLQMKAKSRKKREEAAAAYVKPLIDMGAVEKRTVRYGPNRMYQRNVYSVHEAPAQDYDGLWSLGEWYARRKAQNAKGGPQQ